MKRLLIITSVFLLAAAAIAIAASSAPVQVNIPFAFYAGDRLLPAGEYVTFPAAQVIIGIRGIDNPSAGAFLPFAHGVESKETKDVAGLVFNKYGDDLYFLSQIWQPMDTVGLEVGKSKKERELVSSRVISGMRPTRVIVLAHVVR